MNALATFVDRIANWKSLLLLLAIYVSFPAYWLSNAEATINQLAGKPIGPIDLTMGFNPNRTLQMVADYGPQARAYYTRVELTVDIMYPLAYSLLFAVVLALLFRNKADRPFAAITLLPFVCQLFDYLENAAIVGLLTSYPEQSTTLAVVCELVKLMKWGFLGLTFLYMVYGLFRLVSQKVSKVA